MNMSEYIALCKKKSYELEETYPDLNHSKLLDKAAQELGFKHFTAIVKLEKLLPPDVAPSRLAIVRAGGNPDDSPYQEVSSSVVSTWSQATPLNNTDSVTNYDEGFPRIVTIQQTPEAIIKELGYDPADSENEDSISLVDWEIGGSIEEDFEIESWSDIPEGYELSPSFNSDKDFEDYDEWLFQNSP